MFKQYRDQDGKILGTPTKRRKLNHQPHFDEENEMIPQLVKKKSLVDCFQFIGAINRKDSSKLPLLKKQSINRAPLEITDWNDMVLSGSRQILKNNLSTSMDIEHLHADISSESSQDDCPKEIKLVKRVTMISPPNMDSIPRLYRCNSGIDIEESMKDADERKYGDNIYIQQINELQRKNTKKSKENNSKAANHAFNKNFRQNYDRKAYQQNSDDESQENVQERLLTDYEISSNLHAYVRNHENYLCLNKLERIFYYVKKINFTEEYTQDDVYDQCQLQIRLYNRDDQGHMLRFYQSWEQDQCVYLVFQTASTSLQQKLESGMKLRQNQAWSLLTDACAALTWMKENNQFHLNIKPGNLLKCREKYKLSDPFINKEILSRALKMFKGQFLEQQKLQLAFGYSAPEIMQFKTFLQGLDYDKCDIYSLGICLLENLTGLSVNILRRDLKKIKVNNEKYLKGYSPALRNLLIKMVSLDPTKRPTSQQISCIRHLQSFDLKLKSHGQDERISPIKKKRKLSL